jgi:ammonium transporter Rh
MMMDVHVMIYVGFGFLMVWLKTFSWTAVGFNFLLSAWCFQWSILVVNFWHMVFNNMWRSIEFSINTIVIGDFAAASCMICFGAVLGKADLFQMWLLLTF